MSKSDQILIQRRSAPAVVRLSRFDIFRRMWEDRSECALGAILYYYR
jgi:hypothetical protein